MAVSVQKTKSKEVVTGNNKTIEVPPVITVRELAKLMAVSPIEIIKELMNNGMMANINQQIDFDTVAIIGEGMGYEIVAPTAPEPEPVTTEQD
jgi:translation initiation factor IF-2